MSRYPWLSRLLKVRDLQYRILVQYPDDLACEIAWMRLISGYIPRVPK